MFFPSLPEQKSLLRFLFLSPFVRVLRRQMCTWNGTKSGHSTRRFVGKGNVLCFFFVSFVICFPLLVLQDHHTAIEN